MGSPGILGGICRACQTVYSVHPRPATGLTSGTTTAAEQNPAPPSLSPPLPYSPVCGRGRDGADSVAWPGTRRNRGIVARCLNERRLWVFQPTPCLPYSPPPHTITPLSNPHARLIRHFVQQLWNVFFSAIVMEPGVDKNRPLCACVRARTRMKESARGRKNESERGWDCL